MLNFAEDAKNVGFVLASQPRYSQPFERVSRFAFRGEIFYTVKARLRREGEECLGFPSYFGILRHRIRLAVILRSDCKKIPPSKARRYFFRSRHFLRRRMKTHHTMLTYYV